MAHCFESCHFLAGKYYNLKAGFQCDSRDSSIAHVKPQAFKIILCPRYFSDVAPLLRWIAA